MRTSLPSKKAKRAWVRAGRPSSLKIWARQQSGNPVIAAWMANKKIS